MTIVTHNDNAVPGAPRLAAIRWVRGLVAGSLTRNGYSLVANVAITSALGFVFWMIAARHYSAEVVGRNGALLSALMTVSGIAQLNLGSALNRFLPAVGRQGAAAWVARTYAFCAALTAVAATVFVVGAGRFVPSLQLADETYAFLVWFVAACVAWNLVTMQEGTLAGLRSAVWVPIQNTAVAVTKIGLLLALAGVAWTGFNPFLAWTVPIAIAALAVTLLIFAVLLPSRQTAAVAPTPSLGTLVRYLGGDYIGQVLLTATFTISSIIVVQMIGAAANAVFYVALTIAYALYLISKSMTISLVAEGAADEARLAALAGKALAHALAIVSLGVLFLYVTAPIILGWYGPVYAADGVHQLRLLALSAIPFSFTAVALGIARVQGRMVFVAVIQGCILVLTVALSVPLTSRFGASGMAMCWLLVQTAIAPVAIAISIRKLGWASVMAQFGPGIARPLAWLPRPSNRPAPAVAADGVGTLSEKAVGWLVLAGALAVWVGTLNAVDPDSMSDLGLASVMPWRAWLPLALLSLGFFFLVVRNKTSNLLAACYLVAVVVVLHAAPVLEYGTLRYPWAWKHIGLVDYLERHGAIDPASPFLSAYHNWPGLFAATALATGLSGFADLATVARWWPLAMTLLYVAALSAIFWQLTTDRRIVFAGLWIFVAANWVGQDYYSPQSVVYLFYLVFVGLCLASLVRPGRNTHRTGRAQRSRILPDALMRDFLARYPHGLTATIHSSETGAARASATGTILALIAAITLTHQFTPLVVMILLAVFAATRLIGPGLLVFTGTCFLLWTVYGAGPFLAAHLAAEIGDAGTVANFASNLVDTAAVSTGQAIVSWASRLLTLAVGVVAIAGLVRRYLGGYRDLVPLLLILAPVPVGLLTSYGGEVIFRVYLFALPGLAFLAAAAIVPPLAGRRAWLASAGAAAFGLALTVGFVFANNGKDRQYAVTPDEVAGVEWLYDNAPAGSLLIEGAALYPRQMKNYERFVYVSIADESPDSRHRILTDPANTLASWLDDDRFAAAFVILTRSQKAFVDAVRPMPAGSLDAIEEALLASPRFVLVHETDTVKVFGPNPGVARMGAWVRS